MAVLAGVWLEGGTPVNLPHAIAGGFQRWRSWPARRPRGVAGHRPHPHGLRASRSPSAWMPWWPSSARSSTGGGARDRPSGCRHRQLRCRGEHRHGARPGGPITAKGRRAIASARTDWSTWKTGCRGTAPSSSSAEWPARFGYKGRMADLRRLERPGRRPCAARNWKSGPTPGAGRGGASPGARRSAHLRGGRPAASIRNFLSTPGPARRHAGPLVARIWPGSAQNMSIPRETAGPCQGTGLANSARPLAAGADAETFHAIFFFRYAATRI